MAISAGIVWSATIQTIEPTTPQPEIKNVAVPPIPEPIVQKAASLPVVNAKIYVPILMYHYIRAYTDLTDPLGIQLSVSPATFDKQLATLAAAGYQTISLQDFAARKIKDKSIILTFDDGYDDHYTQALPILQKYHDTATFFIVSGFVGRSEYMTKAQIQQLADAGMEIGGHTIGHKNLASMEYEPAVKEIALSMTDRAPVFAYPSGKYNPVTLDIVSGLGIEAAVTTNLGVATETSSLYELPRIRVKEPTDLLKVINEEISIAKRRTLPSQRSITN